MGSIAMVNNFRTNFQPVQVADVLFRYSFTSHGGAVDSEQATTFGWGAATPLVPVCLRRPRAAGNQADPGPWLPPAARFWPFDQSNVILLAFKAAEDGDGLIVRLAEIEGRATTVTMTLPFVEIAQALQTNMVEEDEDGGRVLSPPHG